MVSIPLTPTQACTLRQCTPYPSDTGDAEDVRSQATPTPSSNKIAANEILELTSSEDDAPTQKNTKKVTIKQEPVEDLMVITSSEDDASARKRGKTSTTKRKPRARRTAVEQTSAKSEAEPLPSGRKTRSSSGISKKRVIQDAGIISSDDDLPLSISPAKKPKVSSAKADLAKAELELIKAQLAAASAELAATKARLASITSGDVDTALEAISPNSGVGQHVDSGGAPGTGQLLPAADIVSLSPLKLGVDKESVAMAIDNDNPFLSAPSSTLDKGKGKAVDTPFLDSLEAQRHFADEADEALRIQDEIELATVLEASRRDAHPIDFGSSASVSTAVAQDIKIEHVEEGRLHPDEEKQLVNAIEVSREERASSLLTPSTSHATGPQLNVNIARKTFKDVIAPTRVTPMMTKGPVLADYMQYRVTSLPDVCGAFLKSSQDEFLAADYPSLPHLKFGTLKGWGDDSTISSVWFSKWADQCPNMNFRKACLAVRFAIRDNFVNASRASPLSVYIEYVGHEKRRSTAHCNGKPAIFLSAIMSRDCFLYEPVTTGLKNKYISGHMHHQEYERFACFACTIFDKKSMVAQIKGGAISFTTLGNYKGDGRESASPTKPPRNPSILSDAIRPGNKVKPIKKDARFKTVLNYTDEVPVYDGRDYPFNFDSDLDDISSHLPLLGEEIPSNSFVVVGYTMGHYEKDGRPHLSTNVVFAILLGTEYDE